MTVQPKQFLDCSSLVQDAHVELPVPSGLKFMEVTLWKWEISMSRLVYFFILLLIQL